MKPLIWNILLAAIWAASLGELTLTNLATGFALGYAMLWLAADLLHTRKYYQSVPRLVELLLYFVWELLVANVRVTYDVITPRHRMRPGIFALPLDAETEGEITLLANLISLTPGTVALDVSPDKKYLYIHAMYIDDVEEEKRRLKTGFERRLLRVLR